MKKLKKISTKDLFEELKTREGTKFIEVNPKQEFSVLVQERIDSGKALVDSGPVQIIVNYD
ncbi:BC1881 family protein [Carnobacterium sp. PL12RED10]|nr:BC1881 family protein [Carnobacterium sp. PL12RED10]